MFEALLAWLAGTLFRIRRAHVEHAIHRAGIPEPRSVAVQMYKHLARGVAELLRASRGERLAVALDPALAVLLSKCRREGTGLVLACAHTANWELCGGRIAREIPLYAVVKSQSISVADRFIRRLRSTLGITLVDPANALRTSRDALARGAAVILMIDQVPASSRHSTTGDFLGAPVSIERSPAALALRAHVPLALVGFKRTPHAGPELSIELLATYAPPTRAASSWIPETMRAATTRLDAFVRAHPADWMWLHRRWRAPFSR